ncbi:MAG TPA: tetratricopeptide repeat protein [Gemmataceae bacterium]|nr:tetratricopeptide repeat protein [Gemmataceae bacterium]
MSQLTDLFNEAWRCQQANDLARAESLYRELLQAIPQHGDLWCLLGGICVTQGRLAEAEENLRRGLQLGSSHPTAEHMLGVALAQQGQWDEAEALLRQFLSGHPNDVEAHCNMANLLNSKGCHDEAIDHCRQALAQAPNHTTALNNLGIALSQLKKQDEAITTFEQALELDPSYVEAHLNLGAAHYAQSHLAEAAAHCQTALRLRPSNKVRVLLATMLPPLYQSTSEMLEHRQQLVDDLHRLHQENVVVDLATDEPAVEVPNLFYLAYQGLNDRDIQRDFARLFRPVGQPAFFRPVYDGSRKIKIGFLSRLFKHHTIGRLMRGLIAKLSRELFDVTVLSIGHHTDEVAQWIQRHADHYVALPAHYLLAAQIIAQQQLDVLFYTDLGMESISLALAHSRLAPVQCVTWGHPVTTGIDTIDYFISCADLETEESDQHYTETLIRLKTSSIYYYRPEAPEPLKDRSHFGLAENDHVYACPQSLFKFHPEFDAVLGNILRGDPQGKLVLLEGPNATWVELLKQRFAHTLPDVLDRIQFLPPLSFGDFLNLLAVSDLLLDPLHFGGGNTSYEGLAMGTPIVTLPTPFLRGRITYSLYRQMGVLDCVANEPEEYVKIALRLGTDADYREAMRRRITDANHLIYENSEGIRELEVFLQKAVSSPHHFDGPTTT